MSSEPLHSQPLEYFIKTIRAMDDKGFNNFKRQVNLEFVRRHLRALPMADLKDLLNFCITERRERDSINEQEAESEQEQVTHNEEPITDVSADDFIDVDLGEVLDSIDL